MLHHVKRVHKRSWWFTEAVEESLTLSPPTRGWMNGSWWKERKVNMAARWLHLKHVDLFIYLLIWATRWVWVSVLLRPQIYQQDGLIWSERWTEITAHSPGAWLSGCQHPPLYSAETRGTVTERQSDICLKMARKRLMNVTAGWKSTATQRVAEETRQLKVALNAGRESNLQHPHNNKVPGLDLITAEWERWLAP